MVGVITLILRFAALAVEVMLFNIVAVIGVIEIVFGIEFTDTTPLFILGATIEMLYIIGEADTAILPIAIVGLIGVIVAVVAVAVVLKLFDIV